MNPMTCPDPFGAFLRPKTFQNKSDAIKFKKIIEDDKGKILTEEYWGLKNLAYEINKNKKAHYSMLIIETLPDKIEEYERKLRLHEDIIRFMTIKIKTFDGKQSIMVDTTTDGN